MRLEVQASCVADLLYNSWHFPQWVLAFPTMGFGINSFLDWQAFGNLYKASLRDSIQCACKAKSLGYVLRHDDIHCAA